MEMLDPAVRTTIWVVVFGIGVETRVTSSCHADLGQLLRLGAVLVHMPLGRQSIGAYEGEARRSLVVVGRVVVARASRHWFAYGGAFCLGHFEAGIGDRYDFGPTQGDRLQRPGAE